MKRSARALWCLAIAIAIAAAPVAAFADAGMEGLWKGEDMDGELTMMLGGGGAFIELRGDTWRAGTYLAADEEMRLYYSDGTERAYLRDLANDSLTLTDEDTGAPIDMRRAEIEVPGDLVGVWTMQEEGGSVTSPGMVGIDAWGEFFLVYDLETGECEKGICLFGEAQDEVTLSFDAGMVFRMGLDVAGDLMTLTDRDSGQMWTLERFRLELR